jgi:hypothetical protein
MSKREAPMTEGFWLSQTHGLFISEFPLVQAAADRGVRRVDGLILPDEPHGRGKWRDYASLTGRRVIIVQAKVGRMKMSLMGQALFSARLALACGVASVRSILLCQKPDAALLPLLKPFREVEVWLSDPTNPSICKRITD